MRRLTLSFILLLLIMSLTLPVVAAAADPEPPTLRIKGKVSYVSSLAYYGILSEDGKQYQPVKPLPRSFQKDGLAVVVEAKLRPDLVAARMYGVAIEVLQINKAELYVSPEEREAIRQLLIRMDAFNNRDLAKLREIDLVARSLTQEQFDSWRAGWGKYTLHYVEAAIPDGHKPGESLIAGYCLYSRERVDSMAISGNSQLTIMNFTLSKKDGAWVFTQTSTFKPDDPDKDIDALIDELLEKAKQRFGTTNLAEWKK
jgi:hypothetical protein